MTECVRVIPASVEEVRTILRAKIEQAGSMRKAAKKLGITAAYLCDIIHERRNPGPRVAKALGFRREVKVTRTVVFHVNVERTASPLRRQGAAPKERR
jgi:hypothetical protein